MDDRKRDYIGSHDIAAICGVHPFLTPLGVYSKLKYEPQDEARDVAEHLIWGLRLQRPILEEFCFRRGLELDAIQEEPHKRHKEYRYLGSTPDALVRQSGELADAKNIRFKTAEWGDEGTDQVPKYVLIGMHWHMQLHDMDRITVSALFSGSRYEEFEIRRDPEMDAILLERAVAWYDRHIVGDTMPDLDSSEEAKRILRRKYPRHSEGIRPARAQELRLIKTLHLCRESKKRVEEKLQRTENQVKALIGESEGILFPGGKITWRTTKDVQRVDWKAVANELFAHLADASAWNQTLARHTVMKPGPRRFLFSIDQDAAYRLASEGESQGLISEPKVEEGNYEHPYAPTEQ